MELPIACLPRQAWWQAGMASLPAQLVEKGGQAGRQEKKTDLMLQTCCHGAYCS